MVATFVRFPAEGTGVPFPTNPPSSQKVIVGGPYRYVRNPMYVSFIPAIVGQALPFGRPVLVIYTATLIAALMAFVRWYEEPMFVKRFGDQYETYRRQVPGWWPRVARHARGAGGGQSPTEKWPVRIAVRSPASHGMSERFLSYRNRDQPRIGEMR